MNEETTSRRARQYAERNQRIVAVARALAESGGWDSVTTRRLAEKIEYSQPVLYTHFPSGKPQIMDAVALQGFSELAQVVLACPAGGTDTARIGAVVRAYLDFAAANPAVYEVMFSLPIAAKFATEDSEAELKSAFNALAEALRGRSRRVRDLETLTEVFWSALHGLASLGQAQRLRPQSREARIGRLVTLVTRAAG